MAQQQLESFNRSGTRLTTVGCAIIQAVQGAPHVVDNGYRRDTYLCSRQHRRKTVLTPKQESV